jgi:glycosyltransferase involved in cell wall biosynthesis
VDPAPTWRGGERQVLLLATELARRGIGGAVVAAPGSPLARRAREAELPVETARVAGDLDPAGIGRLASILRRHRPDVVHLHTARAHAAGGIAARLVGLRPVVVTRRVELVPRGPFGRWKYRHLADHYVAISGAVEESLRRGGVTPERVTRVPSGLPVPLPGARPRRPDGPYVIGTLAAFTPQKGPETWVRTVARLAEADAGLRFVWAGEGELRRQVEVAIHEAGLEGRVSLPGFLEDPESFWREIDLFFLPSTFEALGTVLLDAMAHGRPVVATPVGGIPEVVRPNREGLLAEGPEELARRVLEIRGRPELAERLGRAGRERAEDFRIDRLAERVIALYRRLTGGSA